MFRFLELEPESFGIDISDSSLKIIKLKKRRSFFELASWGEFEIKKDIVVNGEIKNEGLLAESIREAVSNVKGEKLNTSAVVASLPENKAFLQIIKMPKMALEELRIAVPLEAENYIPLPAEKCHIDFEIVKSENSPKDSSMSILMAAFPNDLANAYLSVFKKAGLAPKVFEIESQSISRALIKDNFNPEPILIIDFGKNNSSFIIFYEYAPLFTSSVSTSSDSLTQAISKKMGLNFKAAEKIKKETGILEAKNKTEAVRAMMPLIDDLLLNGKKCFDYFNNYASKDMPRKNKRKISKILLCGGGSRLKGLPEYFSSVLKIPVEIGNPWTNVFPNSLSEIPSLSFDESVSYSTAIGLAIRGLKEND